MVLASEPRLVVSVKHRPDAARDCRELTQQEKAGTMRHMQSQDGLICERNRPDVRVGIWLDGKQVGDALLDAMDIELMTM